MSSSVYVNSGIAGVLLAQIGATAIPASASLNVISTSSATNNAFCLPYNQPSGVVYEFVNNGVAPAQIFPPTTTVTAGVSSGVASGGAINSLAANAAYVLGAGSSVKLISAGSNNFYSESNSLAGSAKPVYTVTAATTLTAGHSGGIIMVNQGAAYLITIPSPATAGLVYDFVLTAVAANVVQIGSGAANILGFAYVGPQAGATIHPSGAAKTTVRFSTTCLEGDRISMISDGTNWRCAGFSASDTAATGIIFA